MVSSSNLQPIMRVDLVIKMLDDPTQTKTLKFINRPVNQGDATYLPLLASYSGLAMEVGQDGLPTSGAGSIVILDQWESLGENRRIFDYFDRYTATNQSVTVYESLETIGDLDIPSSWNLIYTGKVLNCKKDKDTITFSVSNNILGNKKTYKTITADFMSGSTYQVPEESIGKPLPIIFANANKAIVPAYPIRRQVTIGTGMIGYYAYATNLSNQFEHRGSNNILVKNRDGVYARAASASSPTSGGSSIYAVTSHGKTEFIVPYDFGSNNYIISGASWYCKGQNAMITPVGSITFTLYRHPGTSITSEMTQWEELQSFQVDKASYLTQVRGVSNFTITGSFPYPEICGGTGFDSQYLRSPYIYGLGITMTNYSGSSTTDFTSANNSTSGTYFTEVADGGHWLAVTSGVPVTSLLANGLCVGGTSFGSTDSNGLTFAHIIIEPDASATSCNCTELEVAIQTEGIVDDTSGTITGSANSKITRPDHVLKLLNYTWNGSTWVDGGIIDTTTFSSSYSIFTSGSYQRSVQGFIADDVALYDLVQQIASEMCCALVPMTDGKLALYPWGNTGSVVRTFTDADIISIGDFEETDSSTVINNIKIEYGKSFTNIFDQWQASGKAENLSGVVIINKNTSGYYSSLLSKSESIYGKRELEESGSQFIGDVTSATTRALYYALRHDHTHRVCPIVIPRAGNTDLKLMDIVDILSAHNPSFFGSSLRARLPTYTGTEVDVYKGEYPTQATRKRCQIIGINNDYNGDFPKLTITVREIKSRHKNDPTAANL